MQEFLDDDTLNHLMLFDDGEDWYDLENIPDASIYSLDSLPREVKQYLFLFLREEDIFGRISEISKSWNMFTKQMLEIKIKNLSQEEFSVSPPNFRVIFYI